MKKLFSLLAAVFVLTTVFGQKTIHDPNVQVRTLSAGFQAIEVSGGIDLYLSSGDEAVAVSAKDKDDRDRIITEIKDGVLKIYYDSKHGVKFNMGNRSLKAYVSYRSLQKIIASGGSDVIAEGTIEAKELSLHVSGGSDLKAKVNVASLLIDQAGGSDVNLTGFAASITIRASGGSDFSGYDLVTDVCDIDASGASDVDITVNKEFSAEASGASDVSWKGKASIKKAKASGAGSVSHRS